MSNKMPLIIANWKMKLSLVESRQLAEQLKRAVSKTADVVVCPSFASLSEVAKVIKGSTIALGGQNCFWEATGAFTGEVSPQQLREVGCSYVIVGHSERRQLLAETNEMVHKKVEAALAAGLVPIICVGETLDQRQQGAQDYVLIEQTTKALEGIVLGQDQKIVLAYEPVWSISPNPPIEPSQAELSHQIIRQTLFDLFSSDIVKNNCSIIYGGSVDSSNVTSFIHLENTSGVLVGLASLKATTFIELINQV